MSTPFATIEIRSAGWDDLAAIVELLADDPLGADRERPGEPLAPEYRDAFRAMLAHPGNELLVATEDGAVVGCVQVTFITGLSRLGAKRALIEGVRVASSRRGRGIGEQMIRHVIDRARAAGCALVQLTTDSSRTNAHRFYERLGFVASHVGMKLSL